MKKLYVFIMILMGVSLTASSQDWQNNNNNNDYCYGGGMMWNNNNNDYCYGPNMMGGYWMDNGWHKDGQSSLNLNNEQKEQWNNVANQGRVNQQAVNDSINFYVNQIKRLQKTKSVFIQADLNQIKQVLTPAQYTQFLEKLVSGNPN